MFTEEQAAAYLAGLIDGEGTVAKVNQAVSMGNTDYEIIEAWQECCAILGLHSTVYGPRQPRGNRKPYWEVYIRSRDSLRRVLDVVPIRASCKRELLVQALARYKYSPQPSREWLHQKYVVEQLTGPQIAVLCNTSNPRVYKWLRDYGIRVRDVTSRIEPPSREWLIEQYVNGKRSMMSIAQELDVAHTTVYRWLQSYQIPRNHQKVE